MPTSSLPPRLRALADATLADRRIDAADVARLRRELMADGMTDRDEAGLLFLLDRLCPDADSDWPDFYVEALTDFFVWRQEPAGSLSEEDGRFLVAQAVHDGRLTAATECRLLMAIFHYARNVPEPVVALALAAVKETVLGGGHVRFGPERQRPGMVDEADVALLRKAIFAVGGDGGFAVSRREADLLFELHEATRGRRNAAEWPGLFAGAIGHHLMYPDGPPRAADAAALAARERWLESRRGPFGFLTAAARALFDGRAARPAEAPLPAAEPYDAGVVNEAEARWLVGKLPAERPLDAVELALLAHLKATASHLHPSLAPLLAQAGA